MTVTTAERAPKARKPKEQPVMKLTVDRAEFARALAYANAIVEKRNTIPVLSNVLLDASAEGLRIVATDLNMQIGLTVPATVEAEGSTTVSAQLLNSIIRELPDGSQVELSLGENRLNLVSGRSRYRLQAIPADQFPVMKAENIVADFTFAPSGLARTIGRVAFAQSVEVTTRHYLCGIHVAVRDGELFFAATDGNRLGWAALPAPDEAQLDAILPSKFVANLTKLLDGCEDDVRLTFEQAKVTATIGTTVLTSKLVDGDFPDWRRVIPTSNNKRLLISAESLEAAVRRAAVVANERMRAVKIDLTKDKLTASCVASVGDLAVEEAPCLWDEPDLTIGFNARYLLDLIIATGADELQVDLFDAASPSLFTNPNDDSAKWVVMPMRV
jgi:DNA polymerase-3 subunit beta